MALKKSVYEFVEQNDRRSLTMNLPGDLPLLENLKKSMQSKNDYDIIPDTPEKQKEAVVFENMPNEKAQSLQKPNLMDEEPKQSTHVS